jgi:uncharacterized membrane protein YfcA
MFVAIFVLSTLFALWGMGFAIAFVPILDFLWYDFNAAKAIWLFLNSISTWTWAIRNWKKWVLDFKFVSIITVFSLIWAVLWSYLSKYIPVRYVKILFVIFLLFSVFMMLWDKKKKEFNLTWNWIINWIIWFFVWLLSGLLGVGWWAVLVPLLVLIWYDPKYVARNVSFVIAVSTFWWFLTYFTIVKIDWILLVVASVASILWGWLWNYLMNEKLKIHHIKLVLAFLLLILAIKMIWSLI